VNTVEGVFRLNWVVFFVKAVIFLILCWICKKTSWLKYKIY